MSNAHGYFVVEAFVGLDRNSIAVKTASHVLFQHLEPVTRRQYLQMAWLIPML